ncbi:hypothetical protein IVB12_15705 [Bradyrhizobium sp. 179]|uniref:hypothetical protein n=1 Tax=Bradyrhizobium sp. 179 TaxID=2782648 RepID=UPI001FF70401|nr:hypothetical protein [Bradyrhizobium sp. 179]MCK1543361.1 hypothetical protein [Bradyrhizobium sp. 179]
MTKKEAVSRLKRVAKVMFADILDTVLYRLGDHYSPDEVGDDASARRQIQGYMQRWVFEDIGELDGPAQVEAAFQNAFFQIASRHIAGYQFPGRYRTPWMDRIPGLSEQEIRIREEGELYWIKRFDEIARGVG